MQLPEHKASLTITHNDHKDFYRDITQYIDNQELDDDDWATPTSKERAIATDSLWCIRWYPNTPVSFSWVWGATLEEVLEKANSK